MLAGRFGSFHRLEKNKSKSGENKIIDQTTADKISKDWAAKKLTNQKTKLGGGIGFHGWANEWENSGSRHLSWGCVVLHLSDIGDFYRQAEIGAMVVIF